MDDLHAGDLIFYLKGISNELKCLNLNMENIYSTLWETEQRLVELGEIKNIYSTLWESQQRLAELGEIIEDRLTIPKS